MSIFSAFRRSTSPPNDNPSTKDADQELVVRCSSGERSAQFQLYEKYKDSVYSIAFRMANDSQVAEDIVQDVFIKVFKNIGSFRGDAAFSSWLYRITSNVCINHFRKAKRWKALVSNGYFETQTETHQAPDAARQTELAPHLEHAIRQLPEGYRMVFVLHDVQGFRHEEIGAMLNIAIGTSKSQLHKARRELRQLLSPILEMQRALSH
ncbi:MAG: sigma-70 family RNA polymerase sigma factor [Deferribacteres bacterium]|nr:sigma-70 family RNA polymerase sigma factor [candidate division KSB1 bacterium]MCB9508572.1 sigma-70 family RNA polymerase sigma factor [Deferribacteres bacterium]